MAANVRARRPPSPPPPHLSSAPKPPRFPAGHGYSDADERRERVSKGYTSGRKPLPSGGVNLTGAEWKLLIIITLIAVGVRLYKLAKPNSVV